MCLSNGKQWGEKRAHNSTIEVTHYYRFVSLHDGDHENVVRIFVPFLRAVRLFIYLHYLHYIYSTIFSPTRSVTNPKLYTYYHGNPICGCGWLLQPTSIFSIFKNISSKAEQQMSFVRYQTCYTCSANGTWHATIYMNWQSPTTVLPHAEYQYCMFMNQHQQWTRFHVANFAIVCSDTIPQAILVQCPSVLPWPRHFPCTQLAATSVKVKHMLLFWMPHRSETRESHKQLSKVLTTTSTKRSTKRSYNFSLIFITLPLFIHICYIIISAYTLCNVKRLILCLSSPKHLPIYGSLLSVKIWVKTI